MHPPNIGTDLLARPSHSLFCCSPVSLHHRFIWLRTVQHLSQHFQRPRGKKNQCVIVHRNMDMDIIMMPEYQEACWPLKIIWERINHAYSSDTPPKDWGLQKGDYGLQTWVFPSNNEKYYVVWDSHCSYWKVNTPFGQCLVFIGPLFINKERTGLAVPPLFNVNMSDTDTLMPTLFPEVKEQMEKIVQFVVKPYRSKAS